MARSEELEEIRRKITAKLQEAESNLDAANNKVSALEKTKHRLTGELEDAVVNLDRANSNINQLEKKNRSVDKTVAEWQAKVFMNYFI